MQTDHKPASVFEPLTLEMLFEIYGKEVDADQESAVAELRRDRDRDVPGILREGRLLLRSNLLRGLRLPRENNPNRVLLTQAEYEALLEVSVEMDWRSRHALLQRTVDPNVRHAIEPQPDPRVEVVVGHELPAVEEVVPDIADRLLDFPLRLGPVRTARADPEAPVAAEAQELRVLDQPRPPSSRLSPVTTVFIWSNSNSDGTPPK